MTMPWDEWVFDLRDPEEHPRFHDLIQGLPTYPPIVLNDWLTRRVFPLHRCQQEGVIIAIAQSPVPAAYPDETLVSMELSVGDDQGNEISREIKGRVDRCFKHQYQRQQEERRLVTSLRKREGLYGTTIRPGVPTRISPKPNVGSDATSDCQTTERRSISAIKRIHRSTIQ
jgi:hypothetical protein